MRLRYVVHMGHDQGRRLPDRNQRTQSDEQLAMQWSIPSGMRLGIQKYQ
jgi:hypothetical protein